jgi:hypothetical protein
MAKLEIPNLKQTLQEVLDWFKNTEPYRADRQLVVSTALETKLKDLLREESDWKGVAASVEVRQDVEGRVIDIRVQFPA